MEETEIKAELQKAIMTIQNNLTECIVAIGVLQSFSYVLDKKLKSVDVKNNA